MLKILRRTSFEILSTYMPDTRCGSTGGGGGGGGGGGIYNNKYDTTCRLPKILDRIERKLSGKSARESNFSGKMVPKIMTSHNSK